jgi:2-isopropylmalate synthase
LTYLYNDKKIVATGEGNGPIDACKCALMKDYKNNFTLASYAEHSCGDKSSAKAIAYIEIQSKEVLSCFGVGADNDIAIASIKALFSALNRAFK